MSYDRVKILNLYILDQSQSNGVTFWIELILFYVVRFSLVDVEYTKSGAFDEKFCLVNCENGR